MLLHGSSCSVMSATALSHWRSFMKTKNPCLIQCSIMQWSKQRQMGIKSLWWNFSEGYFCLKCYVRNKCNVRNIIYKAARKVHNMPYLASFVIKEGNIFQICSITVIIQHYVSKTSFTQYDLRNICMFPSASCTRDNSTIN